MTTFTYTNPTVGGSEGTWGTTLNANWTALGTFLGTLDSTELAVLDGLTASTAELNILDGVTAATAELNILDGVTATAAELNILDGVTATTAELNYVDGVTSPIQTQLNAKASTDTQPTATWQAGTGTTQSIVSPANVKAAVLALAPSPVPTTAQVGTATAGLAVGVVGSYAFLRSTAFTTANVGDNIAASILDYASTSGTTASPSPAGTWRVMGELGSSGTTTLMLRIS